MSYFVAKMWDIKLEFCPKINRKKLLPKVKLHRLSNQTEKMKLLSIGPPYSLTSEGNS